MKTKLSPYGRVVVLLKHLHQITNINSVNGNSNSPEMEALKAHTRIHYFPFDMIQGPSQK